MSYSIYPCPAVGMSLVVIEDLENVCSFMFFTYIFTSSDYNLLLSYVSCYYIWEENFLNELSALSTFFYQLACMYLAVFPFCHPEPFPFFFFNFVDEMSLSAPAGNSITPAHFAPFV